MKDQNYLKVLDAVVRLEVVKGHLRWKMSDLSRVSGVQRTLIYYYFGKSKEAILQTALKGIGDEFYGLGEESMALWKAGKIKETVLRTRRLMKAAPHVPQFYFHWRHQDSDIQKELISLEKRYYKKIKAMYPAITETESIAVFAVFFGMVITPDVDEAVIERILKSIKIMSS